MTFASAMNACKSASAWKQSLALFADLDKWNLKANTVVTFHLPVQRCAVFSCLGWEWDRMGQFMQGVWSLGWFEVCKRFGSPFQSSNVGGHMF